MIAHPLKNLVQEGWMKTTALPLELVLLKVTTAQQTATYPMKRYVAKEITMGCILESFVHPFKSILHYGKMFNVLHIAQQLVNGVFKRHALVFLILSLVAHTWMSAELFLSLVAQFWKELA